MSTIKTLVLPIVFDRIYLFKIP